MPLSAERRTSVVLALGVAQTLAWGSTYYLPAILAKPMAEEFEVSLGWVYGAFSASMLITALLGPSVGRRIDRSGGRGVLTLSSMIFAAGLAVLGWSPTLPVFVIGWFVIGTGMGMGMYEAAFATLTAIYGKAARNSITGITLLAGFASTICWPISAWIDAELGWRATCFVWAFVHLSVGLPIHSLLIPKASGEHVGASKATLKEEKLPVPAREESMFSRRMLLLGFAFAVTWITSTAMAAHLPRLLEDGGASKAIAIAAAAMVGPAQVAARVLEFSVLQRFHPLLSARLAAITHPLGALAVLVFGPPAAYLFTILHGGGNGIITIAKGTLPLAIFGPDGYGRRLGYLAAPARFGQAASPFIFALLMESYGMGALLITGGLHVLAFAALLMVRVGPASAEKFA